MRFAHTSQGAGLIQNINSPISLRVFANVGPHAVTTRVSYTVPAGRIAHLSGVAGKIMQVTSPTVALEYSLHFDIIKFGGGAVRIFEMVNVIVSVGWGWVNNMPCDFWLEEGDEVRVQTFDGNTGGTAMYNASGGLAEYLL